MTIGERSASIQVQGEPSTGIVRHWCVTCEGFGYFNLPDGYNAVRVGEQELQGDACVIFSGTAHLCYANYPYTYTSFQ